MGKQKNGVTYVSQSKFDKDLNSSVDILIADGADDNTIKEYIQDYKSRFAVAEKKNSVSTGTSEETPSESPIQQPQRKLTSVGGAPIKIGVSASSVGKSKSPFGTPIQTFTEQKAQEFGEIKKKEAEKKKVATKPSVTSPFGLQPKTLETTLFPSLETSIPIAKPIPLSTVVADKQRQREIIKQEGLNEFLDKETKDFEDAVAGEGILNKVENFARSSWNTALAMATNLPFGIGEVAEKTIEKTGAVADKTSVEKYFKQAEREFNKENKTFTPDQLKQKAKEIKLKESKRNYIENQDAQFLEDIRNEEYLDPTTGEKIKIQDALRINDFEKYNTLNKESVKYSNLLKLNKEKVDGFYDDLKQAKNALNHQIIFGNFKYATDIYNNLVSKEDKKQDDLDFISYYEKNKDKAALSPVNPNLKNIVEKLENEINLKSSEFNSALDTQLDYVEKFDKSFKGAEDAYEDFDNSRRSYNNVFGEKLFLSGADTVNGVVKTIQTLAQLSDELKNKIGLPLPGADSLLFNKVFKDYNYYDFSKELEKRRGLTRENVKEITNTNSLLNYISDTTSTQGGQMVLPMLAGYGKLAMPLLRQSAVYFASGFGRGVGESEEFEERVNRGLVQPGEIGKVHTFAEKLIHGGISGGADVLGNLPTALRLSKSFNSLLSNPTTSNMFWKSWTSKGLKGTKDLGTELLKENTEENLAELFQDLSRAFVLNESGVNIGSSISDVTKDTTTFTLISKIFPLMGKGVINRIASSSDKNKLSELEKELFYWKNKLNEDISEETKSIYSDRISKIESEIDKTNKSIVEKVSKDKNAVSAIESLNVKIDNTLLEANKINENKDLSKEEKAVLLKPLENEYKKLVSNRNDIIDGKKKSFDILPEEEKTKFKTQAAEAIIQEELDKGIEKDKIQEPNPEVINKKAIEIYESTKQATGQVSEQEIKPATTEAETPITTQQVDAGLQTQEKVVEPTIKDSQIPLKRETFEYEDNNGDTKIVEVTTNKDGSRTFISKNQEGSTADSTRVGKENTLTTEEYVNSAYGNIKGEPKVEQGNDIMNPAMKAKLTPQQKAELGIKEEVTLTPKTEEDAIQKQITDEGVLQPKQSEMGLQEMEQGDQVDQEPTEQGEEKVSKVTPIKEVKDQLQDLFSAAKEAVRITKDKAKEINKLKNDLNQFVTANLVGLDASDIGKAAIKSINSAIQKTNDVNFEEQAEKINAIIDDLYLRKELKDEKVLEKKIEEMSKDTFYKDKTSSKVTKTKVTDAFKKKIEEAKKNFAKIKSPSIADKTAFVIEMNNLYKQGVSERKKIDEAEKSRSKENANKLSIFALKKDGRVDKKKRISLESKSIEDAFKKGGVIYEGNIYLNTEKGRADFARDTNGLDRVIVNPISTPVTASGSEMLRSSKGGVFKSIKDLKRRYATATFSAERFFAPFYNVKGAKEFIENNWNNKLKVYSERIGRQISEFKDVRDEFLNDVLGKELVSKRKIWAKSKTASRIAAQISILKAIASKKANDPLSAFVKKNEIPFESKMLDETVVLDYELMVNRYDDEIKNAKNESDASKLIKQKEEFVNKYIAFERMTNEGVAALFNMIRQPEGFNKFLNSFSVEDALAIANYVNNNPKIREIADKSSKMFESIRDYVNPTLDKLGYDTLGESDYISKEDALSAMQGKDTKKTEGFYEMLDIIYPDGLPEKVPYFPLSAEGLSGTNESNVLEFFEDSNNPNADYSLLFPSLFTRKAGGNLNLQGLSVESVFDKVSKEAVTLVNGVDIASDLRNLYANEGNNVAMLNAFGKAWNDQFKKKVLNIVKDDAYENAMNQDDAFGKILKNWVATRSMLRVSQLAINVFSAASQLFGIGVAYSKEGNLKYLKNTIQNLLSPSKRKAELDKLSNAFNAIKESKNYKERVNKRRDSADVAAIKSVKEKVGFALVGDVLSDMLFLTTIMDQLSVMFLAPIYSGKYANKEGVSDAEKMDEFFAEEVNKTLQSNAPYYTGTAFYNKTALLLGAGGYLQSPRQGMELILNETEAMLRREGDSVKRTARIIGFLSFSSILPVILKDVFRGSDDEDEDEKSKADKKTEALQVANKIGDAILEATGVGGSAISAIKNAALIKTSPEIMEMDVNPSDIKTSDIVLQSLKSISPNVSITMRGIDNVLDNKEIYSTVDQVAYGIETGIGFPAAQLKKQTDYLTALGSEYYDFNDYWNSITGKVSQSEFKKFEKEIGNLTETLDKVIYPYTTKDGTLNTSFLNKKQINELSKMSFENKANYVEEIRLMLINKAVANQVVLYKKGGDGIDKSKGFYKVRESKVKNELSEMMYDLLKNKYYSEDNAIEVDDIRKKLQEFREDNNISPKAMVDIFKESYKKAEDKVIDEVRVPALKKVKEYSKGRDRAKFIYSVIGDMQNEDKFKYINMLGDEFDKETQLEYANILKIKQERGE